jgi:hypothetical protein
MVAQIHETPCADPVPLGIGPAQDMSLQRSLLPLAQSLGPAWTRPVVQAFGPFGIEAQNGVAQSLPFHAGQPSRLGAGHALQRTGQGKQPQTSPKVPLAHGPLA